MFLRRRLLPGQCLWQCVDQLCAHFRRPQVVDLGERLRWQVLHVGLPVEEELQEDALDVQEHLLDLFLTFPVPVHDLIQVYSAVSLQIQTSISFHKDLLLQLNSITCYIPCEIVHLPHFITNNVSLTFARPFPIYSWISALSTSCMDVWSSLAFWRMNSCCVFLMMPGKFERT